jgi:hypothetical protein
MANISLGPIVKLIDKTASQISKAETKTMSTGEKRRLDAKIKKLERAKRLVREACGHISLNVKVPQK